MSSRRLAAGLLLGLAGIVGCSGSGSKPNVLLITLDTTRADRLGCYGYQKAETPALDSIAASGARFEHAYSQVPLTLPSHATMFTGRYPAETGLRINADAKLPAGVPTLGQKMKERGYRTGAFVGAFVLDSTFELDRGFDVYDDDFVHEGQTNQFEVARPGNVVTDKALAWLESVKAEPFFAWVHLYDPHAPYDPPPPFRGRFAEPYDGEIAFTDTQVRRLLEFLDGAGVRENTLIVVAGDHGESFLEHGEPEHGLLLYDTTIHVPLIVSWPGHVDAGIAPQEGVQLLDLYPTLLELVGAPADGGARGTSFVPALRGESLPPRAVYAESTYPEGGYGWAPLHCLIEGDLKFIEAPRPELYDRRADPGETENLFDRAPAEAAAMRARLRELTDRIEAVKPESPALDAETQAKLRALGYVGGSTPAPPPAGGRRDPKDMLDVYIGHDRAVALLGRGRYREAATILEEILARSPESSALNEELGTAYLGLNRLDEALHAFEISLHHTPDDPDRMWGHAETLRRLGRIDEATERFRKAVERWPTLSVAYLGLSLCYAERGEYAAAYEPATKYAELVPGSALGLSNLANVALALHKYDEAVATANRLLEIDGRSTEGHYVRWEALRAAHKPQDAIGALRESRTMLPSDWLITCSLAWMLAVTPGTGDPQSGDEAVRLAQTCVRLNPKQPRSFDVLGAAHASRGAYADAAKAARQALALLQGPQAAQARAAIEGRIVLYDAGQPYRE